MTPTGYSQKEVQITGTHDVGSEINQQPSEMEPWGIPQEEEYNEDRWLSHLTWKDQMIDRI